MQQDSWDEFVNTHYEQIFAFCYRFLGRREDAEDAVQDCFLKAYKRFHTLHDQSKARSWVFQIARNVCIDRQRWWKRFFQTFSFTEQENSSHVEPELSLFIAQIVSDLPIKQREVFILRHWHGFSTREAAEFLSVSEGTVKSHLKRAITKLKESLVNENMIKTKTTKSELSSSSEMNTTELFIEKRG